MIPSRSVDAIADALDEVQTTLTHQVDRVSSLVNELALAGGLPEEGPMQARLEETAAKTDQLRRSVQGQRALLQELRSGLAKIIAGSQP